MRLEIDLRTVTATLDGERLQLRPREWALLAYLSRDPERVVPKRELLREVWGYPDGIGQTRTVDTHVSRLRAALSGTLLQTVRGFGFRLAPPGSGLVVDVRGEEPRGDDRLAALEREVADLRAALAPLLTIARIAAATALQENGNGHREATP